MSKRVAREQVLVRPTGADPAFEAPPRLQNRVLRVIVLADVSAPDIIYVTFECKIRK